MFYFHVTYASLPNQAKIIQLAVRHVQVFVGMTITLDFAALKTDTQTRRTISDLSLSVAKCKRIVVVTGAGISCSCGIPDFRSSDGLYNLVKQQYPDVILKGRDLFDASLFRDATSTSVFYTFISQLKQSIDAASPTPTHCFIKTLDAKKKLLRSYTQNIDGLEAKAGLLGSSSLEAKSTGKSACKLKTKDVRNVQLHGDIHRVRCMSCSAEYPCTPTHLKMFNDGMPPDCPECLSRAEARVARSARPTRIGSLRPAVVLYDEPHPLGDDIGTIQSSDLARKPDMLIIMGTSLKVHGLRKLVKEFARTVHGKNSSMRDGKTKTWTGKVIFVNKTPPAAEWADVIDYHVAAETDMWVNKVIEDWKKMRPVDWEVQQKLVATASAGDMTMTSALKHVKENATTKAERKGLDEQSENIAPIPVFVSTASADRGLRSPPSPSKRYQAASHYSNLESSPSKRHAIALKNVVLDNDERRLLFTERTNNEPLAGPSTVDDTFDLPQGVDIVSMKKPRTKTKLTTAAQAKPNPPRTRSQVDSTGRRSRSKVATIRKEDGRLGPSLR